MSKLLCRLAGSLENSLHVLQSLLKVHGITHLYELREPGGFDYEMDLELFEPYSNGDEGFWTSENIDWLVYASHERSLTVAGLKNVTYIEDASVTALSSV
jgi:hypothetical protein